MDKVAINNARLQKQFNPGAVVLMDPASGELLGGGYSAQVTFARPNDSAPYLAGDVIGTSTGATAALEFANMGPPGGHVIITDIDLRIDLAALPSGMTTLRLHLYNERPASALVDNAPFDLSTAGDRTAYLGYVDFGTPVDIGSTLFVQTSAVNKKLKIGASGSLFGYLQGIGACTITANTVIAARLNAVGV